MIWNSVFSFDGRCPARAKFTLIFCLATLLIGQQSYAELDGVPPRKTTPKDIWLTLNYYDQGGILDHEGLAKQIIEIEAEQFFIDVPKKGASPENIAQFAAQVHRFSAGQLKAWFVIEFGDPSVAQWMSQVRRSEPIPQPLPNGKHPKEIEVLWAFIDQFDLRQDLTLVELAKLLIFFQPQEFPIPVPQGGSSVKEIQRFANDLGLHLSQRELKDWFYLTVLKREPVPVQVEVERSGQNALELVPLDAKPGEETSPSEKKGPESAEAETAEQKEPMTPVMAQARLEVVEEVRRRMEQTLLGQPEVIDQFVKLETTKAIFGRGSREKPVVGAYLMGQAGTGRNTAVHSYVRALHGYEDAHLDYVFTAPPVKDEMNYRSLVGSGSGYVDSENFSPLIEWLVNHSGGRYAFQEKAKENGNGKVKMIIDNRPYGNSGAAVPQEGPVYHAEDAVLYLPGFEQWSKKFKDAFVTNVLKNGYFEVPNAKGGVDKLYVPVTIVISTSEGARVLSEREADGRRIGDPLSFEELDRKWREAQADKIRLKEAIMATNKVEVAERDASGISEELLNMINEEAILLMRPLSPSTLKQIAEAKVAQLSKRLEATNGIVSNLRLEWSEELIRFLQEFHYVAEENARPIEHRVADMIEATVTRAIVDKKIPAGTRDVVIHLDVEKTENGTSNLVFEMRPQEGEGEITRFEMPINATESERKREPMEPEKISELMELGGKLKKRVFGVDSVIDRISRRVLIQEEARYGRVTPETATHGASKFMLLGLSSTGKTELAKALSEQMFGSELAFKRIDFNGVKSIEDMKNKITGGKDFRNQPIPSEFMRHYDQHNGKAIFLFNEIANAPLQVLNALYDLLDEAVVSTFSDGKKRVMSSVIILMDGNASEEWYKGIPRSIPENEQQAAMEEIYRKSMSDPDYRRRFLEAFFSEAFINRIGENNIFFFGPLSFKARRELTQLKLRSAVKRLAPQDGRHGWNLVFENRKSLNELVDVIDTESFVLREQGRSIDRFIEQEFEEVIRAQLLELYQSGKIQSGTEVLVRFREVLEGSKPGENRRVVLELVPEDFSGQSIEMFLKGKQKPQHPKHSADEQVITAYHEAGHELTRRLLLGDEYRSELVSIIPGVTQSQGRWIRYLGIAKHSERESKSIVRGRLIREIAVLTAGYVAESLVSKGGIASAGKQNDMEVATSLCENGILRWGLSPEWGVDSVPNHIDIEEYKNGLSERRRELLESIKAAWIQEAEKVARGLLLANYESAFVPLGLELAEKGELDAKALESFYEERASRLQEEPLEGLALRWKRIQNEGVMRGLLGKRGSEVELKLRSSQLRPKTIASIEQITDKLRTEQLAEVEPWVDPPLLSEQSAQKFQSKAQAVAASKVAEPKATERTRRSPTAASQFRFGGGSPCSQLFAAGS